jgi:lysophospholipase L1-like esterase
MLGLLRSTVAQDAPPLGLVKTPSLVRDGRVPAPPPAELAKLHKRLADLRAGRVSRVTIVEIGDSHTQGGHFPGRLRALFQARFGNGGRGMLPPGSPYDFWRPYQVEARQTGKWEVFSSNKKDYTPLPYGLSGFVIRSGDPEASIALEAGEDSTPFAVVEVGFYRKPDGGTIDLTVDGRRLGTIDTRGPGYAMDRRTFRLKAPGTRIELRPQGDGSVDIADWSVYGKTRGVVLASFGFSGAQVGIMERWSWDNVRAQLTALDPALIILAFGTNEGYAPRKKLEDYDDRLRARILALRRAAPNASIVLVSGPDANRIPKYCNGNGKGSGSGEGNGNGDSDKVRTGGANRSTCRPLSAGEAGDYDAMLARSDRALCRWHTPASYDLVRRAQRAVARETGALFWDWLAVQGGRCGAFKWEKEGLVYPDRVHMKRDGYWRSADRLFAALMRGYRGR